MTSADNTRASIRTPDATLRVTGGSIVANGPFLSAAIGGNRYESGGTLIVEDGIVQAFGSGSYSAAIGGGTGLGGSPGISSNAGIITIYGGSVYAKASSAYASAVGGGSLGPGTAGAGAGITITGGTLTAEATGIYSTAIGGGDSASDLAASGGPGGSLFIGPDATVTASSPRTAFGGGNAGSDSTGVGAFGTLRVEGTLILPSGRLIVNANPDTAPAPEASSDAPRTSSSK